MDPFSSIQDYPEFTNMNQNMIDFVVPKGIEYYLNIRNLTPLRKFPVCIAASVYRMSAGNSMSVNQDQRSESPWETIRHRQKMTEDLNNNHIMSSSSTSSNSSSSSSSSSSNESINGSTCSALNSSCSSRAISPDPKLSSSSYHRHSKKRSYHLLLREIKRLRGENNALRCNVALLKNDLRDITLSRQDSDASHKKFYDEYVDKNTQLEIDLMDRDDEIRLLKEQIEELKLALFDSQEEKSKKSSFSNSTRELKNSVSNSIFSCYEEERDHDDDHLLTCQPLAHESTLPDFNIKLNEDDACKDYLRRRFLEGNDEREENEDEEEDEEEEDEDEQLTFEHVATSYIHQAILSKLSSARVRLELDDLILKYEPSAENVVHVLADSFVKWICSLLTKWIDKSSSSSHPTTATKVFTSKIQSGIIEFWQSILQYYTTEDENQHHLLNYIETALELVSSPGTAIVDHFDRLIVMLYKYHVVDDDAVLEWWEHPFNTDISRKIRKITSRFIEWVQADDESDVNSDDSYESNEEESDNDNDNDINFGYDDDDDDDEIEFSFAESPFSEETQQIEDDGSDVDLHLNSFPESSIDELINANEREICACQLDKDTIPSSSSSSSKKQEPFECSCNIYNSNSTSHTTEKKKKSVRIAL
ncbi:uncharacterized protein BX663DRAFT_552109 [Cokeromyces recurvatus]|uniref:uncharacterized protein n=1 Tax=Cokeromyces recurvatus TaxID=90255 RepID=UPI002220CC5B|nr:uncharacterized protein BX663DRAFT_552109 [Cokeromyces recurvatus]KAI7902704.1 hypothetical protein BX663DRAFT_552109 [Cokeromyces recurvatus]